MNDLLSIKMSLPESHTQHLQHFAAASSVCHYALQGKTYLPPKCYLLHFPDCNPVPPIKKKKSNVEKTHSSCLTQTTALFFTPASLLIFLPELTGPILRHISVHIRHLQEYVPRAETNGKQKLGLRIPALCHSPRKSSLIGKLSSHFINLRNLQSALLLSQGEGFQPPVLHGGGSQQGGRLNA